MSVSTVNTVIERFLVNPLPAVLALKGSWGSGKTTAWNNLLRRCANRSSNKNYSYVSLFGIESLAQLKISVYTKMGPVRLQDESKGAPTVIDFEFYQGLAIKAKDLYSKVKGLINEVPYAKGITVSIDSLAPSLISDCVVCFDDFERMSKITVEELMGFVVELREERQCKVVLIFNEEQIEGDAKQSMYEKYREKVIDIELRFAPTTEEAVVLAFPSDTAFREALSVQCIKLGIKNIRVLKKIRGLAELLREPLESVHIAVREQAVHTLCLICWCYYEPSEEKPSVEFIQSLSIRGLAKWTGIDKKDAQEQKWINLLREYGFMHLDELDEAILRIVGNGYIEDSGFDAAVNIVVSRVMIQDAEKSLSDAWKLYRSGFMDNANEIVATMAAAVRSSMATISVTNLSGVTDFFRSIGKEELANELLDEFITEHSSNEDFFDLARHPFASLVRDEVIRKRFEERYMMSQASPSFSDMARNWEADKGLGPDSADTMQTMSEEDFYVLFKSNHVSEPFRLVKAVLELLDSTNGMEQAKLHAKNALLRIADETPLNKVRVDMFLKEWP